MPLPTDNDPGAVNPSQGGFDSSGVSYTFGPFSAGGDSPLGGVLGFLNGLNANWSAGAALAGSNYAAGLNLAVNNPAAAGYLFRADTNQQYTQDQINAIKEAETRGLSSNPFIATGQIAGSVFGTGVSTIGEVVGVTGGQAAFGTAQGVQQGVGGVATVAGAGATGGFLGAIQGLGSGVSTGLAGAGSGPFGTAGGGVSPTLILVAVIVLVIILAGAT